MLLDIKYTMTREEQFKCSPNHKDVDTIITVMVDYLFYTVILL